MGMVSDRMKQTRVKAAAMQWGQMQALFAPCLELPKDFGATERERIYTHRRVFWLFLAQVLAGDGSTLSMPDTGENQQAWPQPASQKPGCGLPIMRLLGVFSLGTGIWRGLAFGALAVCERTLFRSVWDHFAPSDIALADTGFCSHADYVVDGPI